MTELDDGVDFKKLAKEVSHALAKDEKYQRENDAKFRAIHQKVKNYDEFRDIVEASHLKPLDKSDKIGGMSYQPWNQLATAGSTPEGKGSLQSAESMTSFHQPANAFEFLRTWKKHCTSQKEKCDFLLSLSRELLKKCLDGDCILGDVVTAFHSNVRKCEAESEKVLSVFDIISSTKRFGLALDFLSSDESQKLNEIFASLNSALIESGDDVNARLKRLCAVYRVGLCV